LLLILGIFGNSISFFGSGSFNRMACQISIIGAVTVFSLGLAYRMRSLLREEREAQRLKDLDDLKTKLYANITHEFRTPLTVIQGMAETLKRTLPQNDGKSLEALNLIKRNGSNLLNLVNQILDLSKLESGRMQLEMKQGDIVKYLRYLVESFSSLAASKNIRLRFPTEVKSFQMDFDGEKLRQVLTNLMSNAIKFTPEGGSVIATVKKEGSGDGERFILIVKDTGKGISAADLPKIFDRYYQADNSDRSAENTLKIAGTGIGLSLTKELVQLMDGSITASSKLGKGTKFTVVLPVSRSAEVSEELLTQATSGILELEPAPAEDYFSPTLSAPIHLENKPLLLIIEDNPDIVRYLTSLLEDSFNLLVGTDGIEGEALAFEQVPDIILSDVMMPGKDGFEVLESLKNDQRTSHIPIVMLTAKSNVQDRIHGLKKGADAYLGKPFEEEELFAILKNLKEQSA
ncbi:MAG: hybrid sensor histidine kinase/response regulator, partial [Bacteroidota bacterium]